MDIQLPLSIIILAAGKGTRMKSDKAKVLHEIFCLPMIHHIMRAIIPLTPQKTIVVVGHQQEAVKDTLKDFQISFATQKEQLGTGHAVLAAETNIQKDDSNILILCGDTPLIKSEALIEMCNKHSSNNATLTLMTTVLDDPGNYGRIISDSKGNVTAIVEQKDASDEQLKIKEINAAIYCVNKKFLFQALKKVGTDNSQGEVYLTDIVALAVAEKLGVEKYTTPSSLDVLGVNSRIELAQAHLELIKRRNSELMLEGVTIYSPDSTLISWESSIGMDSTLHAGVEITGSTRIGKSCTIGKGAVLKNCIIGNNVNIGPYSCLTDTTLPDKTVTRPYTTKL